MSDAIQKVEPRCNGFCCIAVLGKGNPLNSSGADAWNLRPFFHSFGSMVDLIMVIPALRNMYSLVCIVEEDDGRVRARVFLNDSELEVLEFL